MSPHNEGIIGQRYSQRQRLSGAVPPQPSVPQHRTDDRFTPIVETAFCDPRQQPLSTFGLDVDTASYAIVRRSITEGRLPPPEAVRIEEMLNSFRFADPSPPAEAPFAVAGEVSACPWQPEHRLVRIGVSAMRLERRPPCRLVFLIDVSGSMDGPTRLPLVRQALETLVEQLRAEDRVAIVTYSDSARVALPSTRGDDRDAILTAIRRLSASGSTNGAGGIQLAYRIAQEHAVAGVNRVFLCTDGDFNVGISDRDGLRRFITERRQTGLTLTALGFGMGNLHDSTLQVLADSGNGTYAYIDDDEAARTTLVRQLDRHLVMVAKDAKVQVEFNPAAVASYRLIGYEKRALADRDFANDQVDSGDIGAGAHVTVLYQVEPRSAGGLRYQHQPQPGADEMLFVQMRWKRPDQDRSELLRWPLRDDGAQDSASPDQRFAAAVAAFGLALRQSPHRGDATFALAEQLARTGAGRDDDRCAFVALVRDARRLEGRD
jgi:Ca-activated chloride channel family protein